jgi:hypothetical protein
MTIRHFWINLPIRGNAARLLTRSRSLEERPLVLHVYHCSLNPKSPLHPENGDGATLMPCAERQAGEVVISKAGELSVHWDEPGGGGAERRIGS